MTDATRIRGVLSPVVTPFDRDLRPDGERLAAHCRWLLDNDVGLAVFGTNSEANSLSLTEKMGLLDDLVEAGLPPSRMMPGTGACALSVAPMPTLKLHSAMISLPRRPSSISFFAARCPAFRR